MEMLACSDISLEQETSGRRSLVLYLLMNFTIFSMTHSISARHEKRYLSQLLPILPRVKNLVLLWMNVKIILTKMRRANINEPTATVPKW